MPMKFLTRWRKDSKATTPSSAAHHHHHQRADSDSESFCTPSRPSSSSFRSATVAARGGSFWMDDEDDEDDYLDLDLLPRSPSRIGSGRGSSGAGTPPPPSSLNPHMHARRRPSPSFAAPPPLEKHNSTNSMPARPPRPPSLYPGARVPKRAASNPMLSAMASAPSSRAASPAFVMRAESPMKRMRNSPSPSPEHTPLASPTTPTPANMHLLHNTHKGLVIPPPPTVPPPRAPPSPVPVPSRTTGRYGEPYAMSVKAAPGRRDGQGNPQLDAVWNELQAATGERISPPPPSALPLPPTPSMLGPSPVIRPAAVRSQTTLPRVPTVELPLPAPPPFLNARMRAKSMSDKVRPEPPVVRRVGSQARLAGDDDDDAAAAALFPDAQLMAMFPSPPPLPSSMVPLSLSARKRAVPKPLALAGPEPPLPPLPSALSPPLSAFSSPPVSPSLSFGSDSTVMGSASSPILNTPPSSFARGAGEGIVRTRSSSSAQKPSLAVPSLRTKKSFDALLAAATTATTVAYCPDWRELRAHRPTSSDSTSSAESRKRYMPFFATTYQESTTTRRPRSPVNWGLAI